MESRINSYPAIMTLSKTVAPTASPASSPICINNLKQEDGDDIKGPCLCSEYNK